MELLFILLGLLFIILLVVGMFAYPAFGLAVVVIAISAGWIIVSGREAAEKARLEQLAAEQRAIAAIKPTDLKIDDVTLSGQGTLRRLHGVITNMSSFGLDTINFVVTMKDCKGDKCLVVGQANTNVFVRVPAGQMRSFHSEELRFDNLPMNGAANRTWEYKITQLKASY